MLGALCRLLLLDREEELERERCLDLEDLWCEECRREWDDLWERTDPLSKSKKPIVAVLSCGFSIWRVLSNCLEGN